MTKPIIDSLISKGLIYSHYCINKNLKDRKNDLYLSPGLLIPKKGDIKVESVKRNYGLSYRKNETGEFLQNNYYFMLGDNRPNSVDSREWGVIPESQIVGKAFLILYSFDNRLNGLRKIRRNRILKAIE